MKRIRMLCIIFSLFIINAYTHKSVHAWFDETHLAVAKVAGYSKWYNAVGADMAKLKAGSIERYNHFFDNLRKIEVTPEMVLEQAKRYNQPNDSEGHLYGAIIASLREFMSTLKKGKYAEYHLGFCVHYITDLSQPLHNIPYDRFNRARHAANDGIVDHKILENLKKIEEYMYPVYLRPEQIDKDLAREIARIANQARNLGYKLKKEMRDMTKDEAFIQLGHSASLLKAVLNFLKHKGTKTKGGLKK
jgi:hypothetical protein